MAKVSFQIISDIFMTFIRQWQKFEWWIIWDQNMKMYGKTKKVNHKFLLKQF